MPIIVAHLGGFATAAEEQEMRKISVSATRGPEALADIPATVTVISDEDIERELARDIKDLIRYEPGISASNAPTRFGQAGFNIRGIEGNRVATRIDGVRISDAFAIGSFSDARRNLVDLDMLKTVEIVRGPASSLYGSDAIGGVVSFITKDPTDLLAPGESLDSRIKAGYRSDNNEWNVGGVLAGGSESLSALLAYTHAVGEATENQGEVDSPTASRTQPNPQDRQADSLLGKIVWNPNEAHTLRLTATFDRDERLTEVLSAQGRGSGAFANIVTADLDGNDTQERTRVSFEDIIKASNAAFDELTWRLYWQETEIRQQSMEQRYSFSTGSSSTVFRDRLFSFDQSLFGGEMLARKRASWGASEHLFTYGIDLLRTETDQLRNGMQTTQSTGIVTTTIPPDAFPVRDFPVSITEQYAAYVQDQIAFIGGAFLLTPGVRVDYYQLTPKPDDIFTVDNPGVMVTDLTATSVSPKLGAVWQFTDQYSLYANYAHGFRAPPYNDVNIGFTNLAFGYTAIANPDLKAESSDGYEVGFRFEYERAFVSLAGFYNDYQDFINSLVAIGVQNGLTVFQSQNLSEAHIYGAELRAGWQPVDAVRVRASVAYARGAGRNEGAQDQSINSVDPLKGVLGIAYQPNKTWGVELIGTAVAKHEHVYQVPPQFVPDSYFLLDLLLHAELAECLKFNVGVFNLTDEKYWEWSDVRGLSPTSTTLDRYTAPGINFGASVAMQF